VTDQANRARPRWLRRLRWVGAIALAGIVLIAGVAAWGWFVQPALLVVPLRQVGYWRLGVVPRIVDVDGHRWPYLESGPVEGPAVLLLHGFGTSKDALMTMSAHLAAKGWRTLAPDLPGFGAHAFHDGEHHDQAFYARAIGRFMDAVGAPRAVVLGTSMGGALATELALQDPSRVRALVLMAPAGVRAPERNAFMADVESGANPLDMASEADFDRISSTVFARPPAVPSPFRRWFVERALAVRPKTLLIVEAIKPFLMSGLDGRLGGVGVPALVIFGSADRVTDPSMLRVFADGIRNARTALLPGAGHVVFSDAFREAMREVDGFLDAVSRDGTLGPP